MGLDNDPFGKAQTLAVLFVVAWSPWSPGDEDRRPGGQLPAAGERNLAASSIIIFCAYGVLYGASVCLPSLLQSLFGYDAFVSGLVMSPSGVFSILVMLVVGILLGGGPTPLADRRGSACHGGRGYWMARDEHEISPG